MIEVEKKYRISDPSTFDLIFEIAKVNGFKVKYDHLIESHHKSTPDGMMRVCVCYDNDTNEKVTFLNVKSGSGLFREESEIELPEPMVKPLLHIMDTEQFLRKNRLCLYNDRTGVEICLDEILSPKFEPTPYFVEIELLVDSDNPDDSSRAKDVVDRWSQKLGLGVFQRETKNYFELLQEHWKNVQRQSK